MAKRKTKKVHPNSIHLIVASVVRSARFYEEKLGFKMTESHPPEKPVWASLVLGGQRVMIGELPTLAEARQFGMGAEEIELLKQDARSFARGAPGVGASYYVLVPNVDAFARRLKRKRLKPLVPPTTRFYGLRDCQVADPDGYRLVFYTPVEPSNDQAPPADS